MSQQEFIKIKKVYGKTHLKGVFKGFNFVDKETNMIVVFIPSLDISGYGDNIEEATYMVKESLDDYGKALLKLSLKEINQELIRLGWMKEKFRTKIFHPNFNPEEKLVEDGIKNYQTKEITIDAA